MRGGLLVIGTLCFAVGVGVAMNLLYGEAWGVTATAVRVREAQGERDARESELHGERGVCWECVWPVNAALRGLDGVYGAIALCAEVNQ